MQDNQINEQTKYPCFEASTATYIVIGAAKTKCMECKDPLNIESDDISDGSIQCHTCLTEYNIRIHQIQNSYL